MNKQSYLFIFSQNQAIFTIANGITILRIIFTASMILCAENMNYFLASFFFIVAAISDFFDGFFARIRNEQSLLGSYLDPLADKFLISSTLFLLQKGNFVPRWFFICIIFRELVHIFVGIMLYYRYGKTAFIPPSVASKANTAFILFLIPFIVGFHLFSINYPNVFIILLVFNLFLAIFSTLQYGKFIIKKIQAETY